MGARMATNLQVIEHAFRRIGVKAEDEQLTADQRAHAESILAGLRAEVEQACGLTWANDAINAAVFIPVGDLLAAELAPAYGVAGEPRSRPYMRLMAIMRADTRPAEQINAGGVYY
jgi:hypothetical protein